MHSFQVIRWAALGCAALTLAACGTTGSGPAPADLVPSAAEVGRVPDYCPRIGQREETSILRKGLGPEMEYIASIVDTSRECNVLDGVLRMKVGIAGKVVPGPAARVGTVSLPITVTVQRGADILYSNKGIQTVQLSPGVPGEQFVYVDQGIAIPEPTRKDTAVTVAFGEMVDKAPPKKRR